MFNINERIAYLEQKAAEMQAFLVSSPEGSLNCKITKGKIRFYHNDHGKQKYIDSSGIGLAAQLARKKLFKTMLPYAEKELKELRKFSENNGRFEAALNEFYRKNPGCARLFERSGADSISAGCSEWEQEDYRTNPYYPDGLCHETLRGDKVRSKSEACIADMLYLAGIPYRYECEIMIWGEIIYPDFTIMDPETGKIWIWEHFGLMDDDRYHQRTVYKISTYAAGGYLPGKSLITTYEDESSPFTSAQAMEIVSFYFHRDVSARFMRSSK